MLVARGASNRIVAQALSISEKTVEKHLNSARAKLGAFSRTQLVALIYIGGTLPALPVSPDRPVRSKGYSE